MKTGDLVMWKYNGHLDHKKTGVIVSDYTQSIPPDGGFYKNVYWFDCQWVRPIEQQFLEVISESR
tara:strand:- start:476 stop:670 length:195 start_codon:yes stop_codon:yes gene_type:complete